MEWLVIGGESAAVAGLRNDLDVVSSNVGQLGTDLDVVSSHVRDLESRHNDLSGQASGMAHARGVKLTLVIMDARGWTHMLQNDVESRQVLPAKAEIRDVPCRLWLSRSEACHPFVARLISQKPTRAGPPFSL
jgi:hypothetical protein